MFEVYGEITAIVSSEAVDIIQKSDDVLLTLHRHIKSARPVHLVRGHHQQYSLIGNLDGIIAAKYELTELLKNLQSCERSLEVFETLSDKPVFLPFENINSVDAGEGKQILSNLPDNVNIEPQLKDGEHASELSLPVVQSLPRTGVINRSRRKSKRIAHLDPDSLSKNLEKMKLSGTENSSDADSKLHFDPKRVCQSLGKNKSIDSSLSYKFSCTSCSFKTRRSSHFQKHMAIHAKHSALYKCSQCNFTSVRTSHLRRHEMMHSSNLHNCSQCSYRTDNTKLLLRHSRLKHSKVHRERYSVVLSCPSCSYRTTLPRYFERHQRFHCNKQGDKVYQCAECSYKTQRKEHYLRHMNSVHVKDRNFLCHLCGKAFKRADALHQHQHTHEENRDSTNSNYKCKTCEKCFKSLSHLKEHQATHSEARLFLCEICGAPFKTRAVQRKHVVTIHRNPRSYSCHICSKRFNTLYAMKRHQKLHLNNKVQPMRRVEFEPTEISSFTSDSAEELGKQVTIKLSSTLVNGSSKDVGSNGANDSALSDADMPASNDVTESNGISANIADRLGANIVPPSDDAVPKLSTTMVSQNPVLEVCENFPEAVTVGAVSTTEAFVACATIHPTPELIQAPTVLYFSNN